MSPVEYPNSAVTRAERRRPPFDGVTISFHWATVLIVGALFATAWLHAQSHDPVYKAMLLQVHRSLGLTIWVITVSRINWRLTHAKLPPFPTRMTRIHRAFVKLNEYALYALLLGQPVTGLAATLLRGRQFGIFLWQVPQLMPEQELWSTLELVHELGACAFALLIAGHASAALFHHFILRDDVLECMAPALTKARHQPGVLPSPVGGSQSS
jgi:cytochrome b561